MTVWSPTQIAKWLTAAKLPAEQLTHAVALALAATHGADHYRHNPTSSPAMERCGLFALRSSETPSDWTGDLFSPVDSAGAVVAAYRANDDRWDWHPVHVSGAALVIEPMVAMMLADGGSPGGAVNVRNFRESVGRMVQLRDAMVQTGADRGP